jgi:hypothetical protein
MGCALEPATLIFIPAQRRPTAPRNAVGCKNSNGWSIQLRIVTFQLILAWGASNFTAQRHSAGGVD